MKKYFDIIIINLLALAIGLILYFYLGKSIEILSMVVATGISISFGIRQYKIENDKIFKELFTGFNEKYDICLLYTSPSPRDRTRSRMPSSA